MIKGDYYYLKDIASRNVCAFHKLRLEVAWNSQEKNYALRCGECGWTDVTTRQLSLTEEYKAGEEIPEPIKSNIIKGQRRRAMQEHEQEIPFELGGIRKIDLATGEALDKAVAIALVYYARKYGLDPWRAHVCVMYGKPYITIDGYLFHAKQTGRPYTLSARPMTTVEIEQNKIGEFDHGWVAEVSFTETGSTFTGIGVVTHDEMTAKSTKHPEQLRSPVVAAHPWQLGQKRAEWQALRRAFPIGESE